MTDAFGYPGNRRPPGNSRFRESVDQGIGAMARFRGWGCKPGVILSS